MNNRPDDLTEIHAALGAIDVFMASISRALAPEWHALLKVAFAEESEAAKTHLLHSADHNDKLLAALDFRLERIAKLLASHRAP